MLFCTLYIFLAESCLNAEMSLENVIIYTEGLMMYLGDNLEEEAWIVAWMHFLVLKK